MTVEFRENKSSIPPYELPTYSDDIGLYVQGLPVGTPVKPFNPVQDRLGRWVIWPDIIDGEGVILLKPRGNFDIVYEISYIVFKNNGLEAVHIDESGVDRIGRIWPQNNPPEIP